MIKPPQLQLLPNNQEDLVDYLYKQSILLVTVPNWVARQIPNNLILIDKFSQLNLTSRPLTNQP